MFGLGIGELVVIGLFALLFIGPKKLPELAKGLGRGIREFQKAKDDIVNSVKDPDYGTSSNNTQHISHNESDKFECEQEKAEKNNKENIITENIHNEDSSPTEELTSSQPTSIARGELPLEENMNHSEDKSTKKNS